MPTPAETRITKARRAGAQAVKRAAEAKSNSASRSTGTRAAYKVKAEGLDRVLEILSDRKPVARKPARRKR